MTTFVLCYNVTKHAEINPQLISFIKQNKHVVEWSSPFDGFFFLISGMEPRELVNMFVEFFGTVGFFVCPYAGFNGGGHLPGPTWKWLEDQVGNVTLFEAGKN